MEDRRAHSASQSSEHALGRYQARPAGLGRGYVSRDAHADRPLWAGWVFMWEAVDLFFIERPLNKYELLKNHKLVEATVNYCNN